MLSSLSNEQLISLHRDLSSVSVRQQTNVNRDFDYKQGYHAVRLLDEVEQILVHGDIDLERNREQLKSIRRGEWTFEDLQDWFQAKEKQLENVYLNSKIPERVDWPHLNNILMSILETHYGSLSTAIRYDKDGQLLNELRMLLSKYDS